MRILIAAMFLVFGLSGRAEAEAYYYDGNKLHELCQSRNIACLGYVAGVADIMFTGIVLYGNKACIPNNSTNEQAEDVVKAWLDENPGKRHFTAASLVAKALSKTWPCKE